MHCIGLTGMIASGKSSAAQIFQELGAYLISADKISREITQNNQEVIDKIHVKFGDEVINGNGNLNRSELRNIIFSNTESKKWLEDLLHPLIRNNIKKELDLATSKIVVIEIPLLKSREQFPYLDKVVLITTSQKNQIKRLMHRDNCSQTQAKQIIKAQPSLEEYTSIADIVINNDDIIISLKSQIQQFYKNMLCT